MTASLAITSAIGALALAVMLGLAAWAERGRFRTRPKRPAGLPAGFVPPDRLAAVTGRARRMADPKRRKAAKAARKARRKGRR
ncbi:MAG: hypothetical protein RID81_06970 [Sandaracinaceae bacterium]